MKPWWFKAGVAACGLVIAGAIAHDVWPNTDENSGQATRNPGSSATPDTLEPFAPDLSWFGTRIPPRTAPLPPPTGVIANTPTPRRTATPARPGQPPVAAQQTPTQAAQPPAPPQQPPAVAQQPPAVASQPPLISVNVPILGLGLGVG